MATPIDDERDVTLQVPAECVGGLRRGAARTAEFWANQLTGAYDGRVPFADQSTDRSRLQRTLDVLDQFPAGAVNAVTIMAPDLMMRDALMAAAEVWIADMGELLGERGDIENGADMSAAGELGRRIAWAAAECEAVA